MQYLMNIIGGMTTFVVVIPVTYDTSTKIEDEFMQHILIKFGICPIIVISNDNPFEGAYIAMCDFFQSVHEFISKCKHKGLSVERCHRFPYKTVTTSAGDSGTIVIFAPTEIAASYTQNCRIILAIDRELIFPIRIKLDPLLILHCNEP